MLEMNQIQIEEDFYGARYYHILLSEKDLYSNMYGQDLFYTTKTLISDMR